MADSIISVSPKQSPTNDKSADVAALLAKVDTLLRENDPRQALDLLGRSRADSPWLRNAVGVCQLRLDQSHAAVSTFRGMVVSDTLLLRRDVPAVFKTNYATALLLDKNISGCLAALAELRIDDHPAVAKMHAAIQQWKSRLTVWQKIQWYTGSEMHEAIHLDYPPGDLE